MQAHFSQSGNPATVEKLQALAHQLGLNMNLFNPSLTSGKFRAKVMQDDTEGRGLGLTGVPAFFINGVKADDAVGASFDNFKKALDAALAKAGK